MNHSMSAGKIYMSDFKQNFNGVIIRKTQILEIGF